MPAFLTPDQFAARKRRSLWIALSLIAFIVLVFATTVLRMRENMSQNAARVAAAEAPAQPAARGSEG